MVPEPSHHLTRRTAIFGAVAAVPAAIIAFATGLHFRAAAQGDGALTPEMFGARGDGVTNDTAALARLAAAVNAAGGGVISFAPGRTYIVGAQSPSRTPGSRFSIEPQDIIVLRGCTRPVTIRGNGARLKSAPGLRYGTFDRAGRPTDHPVPFTRPGELATPYRQMIRIEGCSGPVEVADLELDGSLASLVLGGRFAGPGRQIPASGLVLRDNRGSETVRNLYTHHHALDGLLINGLSEAIPGVSRELVGVRSEYNGRQGCSITGGRGYAFRNCRFNHTGKAGLFSPPGAGVDIEAEGDKTNRDFAFIDCEFIDNRGVGMLAGTGDSQGALFERCKFVGATGWAAWPKKPRFRFRDCTFVGPIVQAYADPDSERATQFHSCRFSDDPGLSPTGEVLVRGPATPVAGLGSGDLNVLFSNCDFDLPAGKLVLPWTRSATYADCRMRQVSPQLARPRGTYVGSNVIVGNVQLSGSRIVGTLLVNGVPYLGGSD